MVVVGFIGECYGRQLYMVSLALGFRSGKSVSVLLAVSIALYLRLHLLIAGASAKKDAEPQEPALQESAGAAKSPLIQEVSHHNQEQSLRQGGTPSESLHTPPPFLGGPRQSGSASVNFGYEAESSCTKVHEGHPGNRFSFPWKRNAPPPPQLYVSDFH